MQTFIDIEDQQLNKLLLYTQAKNGTEAITKIIHDYLLQKDELNTQLKNNHLVVMQQKQSLKNT